LQAGPAGALSFPLSPGDVIVDINLSASAQTMSYDGSTETLTVTAEVDNFLLADSTSITLSPGQVLFTTTVSLVPGSLFINSDFFDGGTIIGTYSNSPAADFVLWDQGGPPTVLFTGDYDGPGLSLLVESLFGFIANGSLGGTYTVRTGEGDALFESTIGTTGSVAIQFDNLERGGTPVNGICQIADPDCFPGSFFELTSWPGLQDFDAQPEGVDFAPDPPAVPEPGIASLLGLAILGGWLRRRRLGG
jgi:hypothetical protein